MAWLILFLAGLFEIAWVVGLKYSDGFSRPVPVILTLAAMAASMGLLGLAMKSLPMASAYTVWVGIGIVGAFIAGVVLFAEPLNPIKLLAIALVFCGIMLLKLA